MWAEVSSEALSKAQSAPRLQKFALAVSGCSFCNMLESQSTLAQLVMQEKDRYLQSLTVLFADSRFSLEFAKHLKNWMEEELAAKTSTKVSAKSRRATHKIEFCQCTGEDHGSLQRGFPCFGLLGPCLRFKLALLLSGRFTSHDLAMTRKKELIEMAVTLRCIVGRPNSVLFMELHHLEMQWWTTVEHQIYSNIIKKMIFILSNVSSVHSLHAQEPPLILFHVDMLDLRRLWFDYGRLSLMIGPDI